MLPTARWSSRLPRQNIRTFASRSTPPGPRGSIRRSPGPAKLTPRAQKSSQEPRREPVSSHDTPESPVSQSRVEAVSSALATTPDAENSLVTPVHVPEDLNGILKHTHPAIRLLENSAIVVQRQLEMMNVLMGFEQANRYVIMDPHGNHIGYLAEQDHGLGNAVARQMFRTHRSFTTHVFDREEREILRFHRPFSWISSRIRVYDAMGKDDRHYTNSVALQGTSTQSVVHQTSAKVSSLPLSEMRIIGSAEQEWAPLRRKYNMFLARGLNEAPAAPDAPKLTSGNLPLSDSKAVAVAEGDTREVGMLQFARVDEPFLSWDFSLMSEDKRLIGSVNRNFVGFARELFTDTGVYALRMDAAGISGERKHLVSHTGERAKKTLEGYPDMTLDQRAVMLATAVSIDFDYFSRHSGAGGGLWPMWMPWWGGGAAAEGAAAGEAGAVGAAAGETGIASEAGAAARGLGVGEGAAAGAGTMAGYEAMQRARESAQSQDQEVDSQSPQQLDDGSPFAPDERPPDSAWGEEQDPWGKQGGDDDPWGGGSGGGDGGGGGGGGGGDGGSWFDGFL